MLSPFVRAFVQVSIAGGLLWLAVAAVLLACPVEQTPVEPRDCAAGLDLNSVESEHRSAWSAVFEGKPLTDSELQAMHDAQRLLECLADR